MTDEIKQVIILRTDLKMGKGKMVSQACHGAVLSVVKADQMKLDTLDKWFPFQKKIVLKVSSYEEFCGIKKKLEESKIPFVEIQDAGRTQVEPGTATCLATCPVYGSVIDGITGDLKLL